MGIYDTYGDIQIKVGEVCMRQFDIGDEVDIPDGVYIAPDGIIVIVSGEFVAEFKHAISKWGEILPSEQIVTWL